MNGSTVPDQPAVEGHREITEKSAKSNGRRSSSF
jgi:hypothetical protein